MGSHRAGWFDRIPSSLLVSGLAATNIAFGFAFQVVLAALFGVGGTMDTYLTAVSVPTVLTSVLMGTVSFALVPTLIQHSLAPHGEGWVVAGTMLTVVTAGMVVIAAAVLVLAEPLAGLLAPGFGTLQRGETAALLRVVILAGVAGGMVSVLKAVAYARNRFMAASIAPVIGSLLAVVVALVLVSDLGVMAAALGYTVGQVVQVGILWAPSRGRLMFHRSIRHGGVQQALRLALPLMLGATYFKAEIIVDRVLASELTTGTISILGYAYQGVAVLTVVASSGLAVTAFPSLSAAAVSGRMSDLRAALGNITTAMWVLVLPVLTVVGLFAQPLVAFVFERGAFAAQDTAAVSAAIRVYLGFLVGAALGTVLARGFYAMQDTLTPTLIGIAGFTIGLAMKLFTVSQGYLYLAGATSAYHVLNALIEAAILRRRLGPLLRRVHYQRLGRAALASGVAGGLAWLGAAVSPKPVLQVLAILIVFTTSYVVLVGPKTLVTLGAAPSDG